MTRVCSYAITCDTEDPRRILSDTTPFPCVRVTKNTDLVQLGKELQELQSAPPNSRIVSDRSEMVLKGTIETLNIADLPSFGAVGCYLSHLSLWMKLASSDEDCMIIFEDDARLVVGEEELMQTVTRTHGEYDILLLGYRFPLDTLFQRRAKKHTHLLSEMVADRFYETHAYCITKDAASKLIQHALPVEMQVDAFLSAMRLRLGMKFMVPASGAMATQKRSILDSTVQASIWNQCAICRLPRCMRTGWALVALILVVILVTAFATAASNRTRKY